MTYEEFDKWLSAYGRSWIEQRSEDKQQLFTEDATYMFTPFHPLIRGLDAILRYSKNAASLQSDVRFRYEILAVARDYGLNRWWASITWRQTSQRIDFDGIYQVYLDDKNRCYCFNEWWHSEPPLPTANTPT